MKTIEVLDNGYVAFIEPWGSDERIIEAARMSTAKGFNNWGTPEAPGDEKLLTYLYNNNHATPFEMAGMVIEVKAPIFVFREWHRHRTQCLAADTMLNLVSPSGTTFKRSIENIYQLKHGGVIDSAPARHLNGVSKAGNPVTRAARRKNAWRTRVLPNCQSRILRTFDEQAGIYRTGQMRDVWESGIKEIWRVETEAGTVCASNQHPFLTRSGWAKVEDLAGGELLTTAGKVAARERVIPPSLRQGIGVWTTMMRKRLIAPVDTCYLCGGSFAIDDLELDHVIPVSENLAMALDVGNLKPACKPCHRQKINTEQPSRVGQTMLGRVWARLLHKPERVAEGMTYDLEMVGPDNNYVANGLVVHNSYNEMSARYIPLPDENYTPSIKRLMMSSVTNKQAQGTGSPLDNYGATAWQDELEVLYKHAQRVYEHGLLAGVPKELARLPVPVARYSRMRASANLRNWLSFLTLRMAPNAQWEIRQYANAVGELIAGQFPRTWALFATANAPLEGRD